MNTGVIIVIAYWLTWLAVTSFDLLGFGRADVFGFSGPVLYFGLGLVVFLAGAMAYGIFVQVGRR